MPDTWKSWEGRVVDGKFPLLRFVGGSNQSAVFLTERHVREHRAPAAIKLASANAGDGERQLSRWRKAAEMSHPHLIQCYEMGRFELDGKSLVYLVMEYAEENLAQVLRDRALTGDETRAVLEAAVEVLSYLHDQGFVHGHIQPANIMASGEQLKISSDCLRHAGDPLGDSAYLTAYDPPEIGRGVVPVSRTASPSGDIWSLGMTLVEILTQSLPVARAEEQVDPSIPQSLQEPFFDIARHCLLRRPEGRWTVAQIAARLQGKAPALPPSLPPQPHAAASAPVEVARGPKPSAKRYQYAALIAIGFALVLAAVLAGSRLLHHDTQPPLAPVVSSVQPVGASKPSQAAPLLQKQPVGAHNTSLAEEERATKAPAPIPALAHPDALGGGEANTATRLPSYAPAHGEVAHQVMPEVLQSARDSIRGTVRVRVKLDVDRSGNVEVAVLESSGPSKYFARSALAAAQLWTFKPPSIGGHGVLSSWTLEFDFTRDKTTVVSTQNLP